MALGTSSKNFNHIKKWWKIKPQRTEHTLFLCLQSSKGCDWHHDQIIVFNQPILMSILRFFSQQDQILVEYKPYCPTNVEKMYAEIQQCKYSPAMLGLALCYIIKYSLRNITLTITFGYKIFIKHSKSILLWNYILRQIYMYHFKDPNLIYKKVICKLCLE